MPLSMRCKLENLVPARRLKPEKPQILPKVPKPELRKWQNPESVRYVKPENPRVKYKECKVTENDRACRSLFVLFIDGLY